MLSTFEHHIVDFSNWIWGFPLLLLLTGGGLFFMFYSGFIPFRYFIHSIKLVAGRYDNPNDPGQLNTFKALSTALASTVGMGNIAGVAVAITIGGPGAVFWMWVSAFVGMGTNFFTCTQALMYRGKDSAGEIQGGPMYVIREGLGKKYIPMAWFFCICCLFGALPIFQANQLTQAIRDMLIVPIAGSFDSFNFLGDPVRYSDLYTGVVLMIITAVIVIGGIQRIGNWAGRIVPFMIALYFLAVLVILIRYFRVIPHYLVMIVTDAFTARDYHGLPDPFTGGLIGGLIVLGTRRASFSNEAGIGTAPMALGTAKSSEPVREGLVAMLSPTIDTLLVCTLTALAILVTGVWQTSSSNGVSLTATAFDAGLPYIGSTVLLICIFFFALTSLFSYCYYGMKCTSFMLGTKRAHWYNYFYLATIIYGSTATLRTILSVIDAAYALMALPTMISGIILAPRVMKQAKKYFARMKEVDKLGVR